MAISRKVEAWAADNLTSTPPQGCALRVGDVCTFTNDYGVVFHGHKVIGFAKPGEDLYGAAIHTVPKNGDGAFWYPSHESQLQKEVAP